MATENRIPETIKVIEVVIEMTTQGGYKTDVNILLPPTKFVEDNFTKGKKFSTMWELGTLIEKSGMNLVSQVQNFKKRRETITLILNRIPAEALYNIVPINTVEQFHEVTCQIKKVTSKWIANQQKR